MALSYFEATRPYMMPAGGVTSAGEIVGLDPTVPANANAIAAGILVASGAPGAFAPLPTTRVKMTAFLEVNTPIYNAGVFVGVSPATYNVGDIATFLSPISAALIAGGQAVSN